jgi:hypothetical protein
LCFRYGLCLDWSYWNEDNDEKQPSLIETAVRFSPMLKSNTLSPHFYFSKFRHPYVGGVANNTFLPFSKFQHDRIRVETRKSLINFTTNFFNNFFQDRQNYTLKNKTLSFLSKQQKCYLNLTYAEKKNKFKILRTSSWFSWNVRNMSPPAFILR